MQPGPILAIGGAGFDSDQPTPGLDRFFLSLSGKQRPRVCLIPTASGDSLLRIARFLRAASVQDCSPHMLELFRPPSSDLRDYVFSMDAVFVSGGNTYNMLALWRLWGLDQILREAHEAGIPLGGVSAGANCWFEQCSTDSFGSGLGVMDCLGWLPGSCCPHYDSEPLRRPRQEEFLSSGRMKPGWAIGERTGLLFRQGQESTAVADGVPGLALWTEWSGDGMTEGPLSVEPLMG